MVTAERISDEQPVSDYLQRLDLEADPLGGTADYFYAGADRRNILDQVVHYCRFSEQLVVLTAEEGNGKTTLVDATVVQLNSIIDCCRIPADNIPSSESIVASLSRVLRLPLTSLSTRDFLASLNDRTVVDDEVEPVLVIVEQAERLPLAQLESLVRLHEMARSSMHLLLVGTLPLQRRINKIAAQNPNIKQFSLRPLALAELEAYTLSRLQSVGYQGGQPLSRDQLLVLHEQSGGVIAKVNQLMPMLLEGGLQENAPARREWWLPRVHLLVVGLLFLILVAGLLFELADESNVPEETGETAARATIEVPLNLPPQPVERLPTPESIPEQAAQLPVEPVVVEEPALEESAVVTKVGPPVQSEPEPVSLPESVVVKTPPKAAQKPKPRPEVLAAAPPPSAPNSTVSARDERLLAINSSYFMLQVLGSSKEPGVRDYVKRYVGQLPVTYFETQMRGKPWYVVLVGPYSTRELAKTAVQGFPADLKKQSPWVRSVASVQSDIKTRLQR